MNIRRRRLLLTLPLAIIAGLWVVYLLFAWLGFEPLVKWAAPKVVADRSGHVLTIEHARFDPFGLTVELRGVRLAEPDGAPLLAFSGLLVDFEAASVFRRAYTFETIRLSEPQARLELRADGSLNWSRLLAAFAGSAPPANESEHEALPRLLVHHAVIEKGRLDFADNDFGGGFKTRVEPLDLTLDELSTLPDDKGNYAVSARTGSGAQIRWKGVLGLNPVVASGELAIDDVVLARIWPYVQSLVNIAPPQGTAALSLTYRVTYPQGQLAVQVSRLALRGDGIALRGTSESEPALAIGSLVVRDGDFDLLERSATIGAIDLRGGRISLARSADGRLNVQDWLAAPAPAPSASAGTPPRQVQAGLASPAASAPTAPDRPAWRIGVGQVNVDGVAVRYVDHAFAAPLAADIGKVKVAFKADAAVGANRTQLRVDAFGVDLDAIRLGAADGGTSWLELRHVAVEGGHGDLAARTAAVARIAVSGGRLTAIRDAQGRVSVLEALAPATPAPGAPAGPVNAKPASAGAKSAGPANAKAEPRDGAAPWHYRIDRIEAGDLALALREESVRPAVEVTLQGLHAEATGVSDELGKAVALRLGFGVEGGGRFEAEGKVVPAAPSADIRLRLTGLSLGFAQPYVAQWTNLALVKGWAATSGRLVYREGQVRYDGGFAVEDLLVDEADTHDRFLAWKSLSTRRMAVTPERVEIPELRAEGLGAKLVIFKDRTVNVAKILKASATAPSGAVASAAPATAKPARRAPGYRVDVGRVRVSDGDLDFADLSLALPFAARIHDVAGDLGGLSSAPGRAARVELEGQVNEYGLARAAGQIDLFDPAAFTDIKVVFRNIEMTRLTPYSATFAGRKIDSGKLSLDLEYKVKDRKLAGDNRVVMDELTLGEHVDAPGASNLPLDLAVALLQDSDGRIELGLPVSGSLDDPQFSFGGIVWKAIVNVVTKIVTAPFRALGALFGGSDEQLSKVAFDPGASRLLPPEREKLKHLAEALGKRPALAVTVHATYDERSDAAALKEQQLRRAVALRTGRELAPGEDPGPITTADPKTKAALEALFAERFGAASLEALRRNFAQANPPPAPKSTSGRVISRLSGLLETEPPPLPAAEAARLKGADLHALILERLLDAEKVGDEQLIGLGKARTRSITDELATRGIAAGRIEVEAPTAASGKGADVIATLGLAAKGKAGPAAAPAAPASSAGGRSP